MAEHNHPVPPDKVDLRDKRYRQHRCYKLFSLIHINRQPDFFFVVAARAVSGRRQECPILYELIDALGLTRLRDFTGEHSVAPAPPRPAEIRSTYDLPSTSGAGSTSASGI